MRFIRVVSLLALLMACLAAPWDAVAQSGPPPHVRASVDAVIAMLDGDGDASIEAFIDEAMVAGSVSDREELIARLRDARDQLRGLRDEIAVERESDGVRLILTGAGRAGELLVLLDRSGIHDVELLEDSGTSAAEAPGGSGAGRDGAIGAHASAVELAFRSDVDALLEQFERDHLSETYLDSTTRAERRELLARIRSASEQAGGVGLDVREGRVLVELEGPRRYVVGFTIEPEAPWKMTSLALEDRGAQPAPIEITVDGLDATVDGLVDDGYSGVLYVRVDGDVVLDRAFGMANAKLGIPVSRDTVFGTGSRPIDFTKAAVFLLEQQGLLDQSDTIDRWLDDVPPDKRSMTIRHLMNGRSGLVDFFHEPEDWDPDLAWVDRDTAVRRLLRSQLLFEPGSDRRHSHAAFGLLAALVEKISGQNYESFLRDNFFEPAGMTRTGMYGDRRDLSLSDFAVGQGPSRVGLPNIPPNWGPTSWLVMGSGGMYSSLPDLLKFYDLVRNGDVLDARYAEYFRLPVQSLDGSERGFELYSFKGEGGSELYLMVNAFAGQEHFRRVMRGLGRMMEQLEGGG